jgi:hypothetical protein
VKLLLSWWVCAALLGVGCTAIPSAPPRPEGPSEAVGPHGFVRSCESSVFGDLGAGWRRDALIAGPVAFVGARGYEDDPKRSFRTRPGRATAFKVLLVITGDRPILVSLRTPGAALFYNPSKWGLSNNVPFRAGDEATRFEPCRDANQPSTQFNGGFLVRRPMCVPVEVRVRDEEPVLVSLSFGTGKCT